MPAFTLKVGPLADPFDLASYVRMQPGEGFDLFNDGQFQEPGFSDSPLGYGQDLVSLDEKNREITVPLHLSAATKDALHLLIVGLTRRLGAPDAVVESRDDTATASTYYDLVFGRFEPDYSYFLGKGNRTKGVLKLQVRPYGHTATSRIVATVAASGPVGVVQIPSGAVLGDVAALGEVRVRGASQIPWLGDQFYGAAVLPHASYPVWTPAASIPGTLVGASGMPGSQVLLATVSLNPEHRMPLFGASILAGGRHRVLAVMRTDQDPGHAIYAMDFAGQPIGPTAIATAGDAGLVDLGVLALPSTPVGSAALVVRQGALPAGIGYPRALGQLATAPAGGVAGIVLLPENTLTMALDAPGRPQTVVRDDFVTSADVALAGRIDDLGNAWPPVASAHGLASHLYLVSPTRAAIVRNDLGGVLTASSTLASHAILAPDPVLGEGPERTRARTRFFPIAGNASMPVMALSKMIGFASGAYQAGYGVRLFSDATTLDFRIDKYEPGTLAPTSVARATIPAPAAGVGGWEACLEVAMVMSPTGVDGLLRSLQGGATGLAPPTGPIRLSASAANHLARGQWQIGLNYNYAAGAIQGYSRERMGGVFGGQSADGFAFDAVGREARRYTAASLFVEQSGDVTRGPQVKLGPSAPAVAVLSHPMHSGAANGALATEIRVRERFTYAR